MKGAVIWITGLPSSGKSVLAERVHRRLKYEGKPCCVLDGDEVREALVPSPGYDEDARNAFYETLARLAALLARQGLLVIVPATAHLRAYRDRARELAPRLVEAYVHTDRQTCAHRDSKGLYAAVQKGQAHGLPGVDLEYEPPHAPEIVALGGYDEAAIEKIVHAVA